MTSAGFLTIMCNPGERGERKYRLEKTHQMEKKILIYYYIIWMNVPINVCIKFKNKTVNFCYIHTHKFITSTKVFLLI